LSGDRDAAAQEFELILDRNPNDHAARFHLVKAQQKVESSTLFELSGKR
jgi:hypothetical protein